MVFDQLENLVQSGGSDARLLAYANLAAELVDTMRGLVLAHMALDTEWQRAIEPTLNLSQRSRLIMHQQALSLPNAKEREELLRLWISRLTEPEAPYPWPFSERHLNQLLSAPGLTPRMLLVEFQRALDGDPAPANEGVSTGNGVAVEGTEELGPNDTSAGLDREWEQRLRAARAQLDAAFEQRSCVDAARVSDGLLVRLRHGVEPSAALARWRSEWLGRWRGQRYLRLCRLRSARLCAERCWVAGHEHGDGLGRHPLPEWVSGPTTQWCHGSALGIQW